jgi:SAM-dependent methyltransferase
MAGYLISGRDLAALHRIFPRMGQKVEFTGERYLPTIKGEIAFEHLHRYAFARRYVHGKRVLDAACGEGYGTAMLASTASGVSGVDIDRATIAHAKTTYGGLANAAFHKASVASLPFPDASFDVIASFETIEHLDAQAQFQMLAEFSRVLTPKGMLMLSAPNRVEYSDKPGFRNPFHLHEHDLDELEALVALHFRARILYLQRVCLGSMMWRPLTTTLKFEFANGGSDGNVSLLPPPMYHIFFAAHDARHLPSDAIDVSFLSDPGGTEMERLALQGGEIVRLDALLGERTASLNARSAHVEHLEHLVGERDRIVVERDLQLRQMSETIATLETRVGSLNEERVRTSVESARLHDEVAKYVGDVAEAHILNSELQAVIKNCKNVIDQQHSLKWWLLLPWIRMRAIWKNLSSPK